MERKTDKKRNVHAVALGRLARGVPKNFSPQELARRAETMRQNQTKRWSKKYEQQEQQS